MGAPKKWLGGDGRTKNSEKKVMSNDPEIKLVTLFSIGLKEDACEVKLCRSNFIFYVLKCNSLTTNSK